MSRTIALLIARSWMTVCAFGAFIAIGRSLAPAEFGIFVLASSIVMLPEMLIGAGFYERTMSHGGDPLERSTAYWCTAAMGAVGCVSILAIAAVIGLIFGGTTLAKLLAPLSAMPLFWGFAAVHEAALIRDNKGTRVTIVLGTAETLGLLSLLASLTLGYGIFGLVVSKLVNAAVTFAGYAIASNRPFPTGFDRAGMRNMLGFSRDVLASRLVGWVDGYAGDMLVASVLSASGLGLYRMGTRLFMAASVVLQAPGVAQIAVTGEAAERGEGRMSVVTARFMKLHAALALPVFAGLAAAAQPLIDLLLNPEWASAAGVTAVICLAAPAWILMNANTAVLLARGQSRLLLYASAASAISGALAILLGAMGGPLGAAAAKAIVSVVVLACLFVSMQTLDRSRLAPTLLSLLAICAAAGGLALTVSLLLPAMGDGGGMLARLLKLAVAGTAGLFVYAVALRVLAPRTFRLARFVIRRNLRQRKRAALQGEQVAVG